MSDGIPIHFFFPNLNHNPIRTQAQKETRVSRFLVGIGIQFSNTE